MAVAGVVRLVQATSVFRRTRARGPNVHYSAVLMRWSLLGVVAVAAACKSEAREQLPEEVVADFVEKMSYVHGEPKAAKDAYQLLWSDAKRNLIERAKRASAVAGRKVAPEEMLVPSRFSLAFKPKRFESRVSGDWAQVTIFGDAPATQQYQTRCAREEGKWRVVVELPPIAPIQRRPDAEE